jgi:hypothetical protein
MSRQPATSARAQVRGVASLAAIFALVLGASCGNQTFNLLGADAGTSLGGVQGTAGDRTATAGADRGGSSSSRAGGNNAGNGNGGFGRAGGGPRNGGGAANGGFGTNGGLAGDAQGGSDQPCLPGESCVDGGVSCPPNAVGACTRCTNNNDCGHDGLPYCDVTDGRCVECFPNKDNCKVGENCDPTFLRCAKACQSNTDCNADSSQRICAGSRHVCVECTISPDCAAVAGHENYQCAGGFCVECLDGSHCPDPTKPICQQWQCVPAQ